MAIQIIVRGPKGAGKSYLIGKLVVMLKAHGYEGALTNGDAAADIWSGTNGVRVAIEEVDVVDA